LTGAGPGPPAAAHGPVLVIGGGAVGSFLATLLAVGGEDVVVLDQPGTRTGPDEIRLLAPDGRRIVAGVTRADDPAACPRPDFAVFAVRMTELATALPTMARWPDVPVVTVENGLGAEEMALAALPDAPVIAASLVAPIARDGAGGFIWPKRRGLALAGVRRGGEDVIIRLQAAGTALGLPVCELPDWRSMKWSKLLTNLTANATCAILGWDPAAVYADRRLFALERLQIREALDVMDSLGIRVSRLPGADVRLLAAGYRAPRTLGWPILARVVGGARGGKLPSLALHVAGPGGPSEVRWLNGGVARAAAQAGHAAPINATLSVLVEEVAADAASRARLAGNPTALLARISHAVNTQRES
jgi:2-dehydropantoate 2-reductase